MVTLLHTLDDAVYSMNRRKNWEKDNYQPIAIGLENFDNTIEQALI
jgi:hypothetical protein